jgi:hypothetical protein
MLAAARADIQAYTSVRINHLLLSSMAAVNGHTATENTSFNCGALKNIWEDQINFICS